MLPRRWEDTWLGKKTKSLKLNRQKKQKTQEVEFTIMTYNILAQRLLEDHHHLYGSSSPSATDWNLRRRRLVAEISYHRPDVGVFSSSNMYIMFGLMMWITAQAKMTFICLAPNAFLNEMQIAVDIPECFLDSRQMFFFLMVIG